MLGRCQNAERIHQQLIAHLFTNLQVRLRRPAKRLEQKLARFSDKTVTLTM